LPTAPTRWARACPPRLELCTQFDISRFTAREAIRVLSTAGLVTRRQRVGTVVIATPDDARFTHDASSLRDLHQYAQDTELRFMFVGRQPLDRELARQLDADPGSEWTCAVGLRVTPGEGGAPARPICITRLYLSPLLKGIDKRLRGRQGAVYALIEAEFGHAIERVDQELQAVTLDADDAANLGARTRRPGAAHRAPLPGQPGPRAGDGRERAPRRPLQLPHAAAQVGAPRRPAGVDRAAEAVE
jgi:GntR family transcriptional regulator